MSRQIWMDGLSSGLYFIRQGICYWRDLIVMKSPYRWSAQVLLPSNRLKKVEFFCESNLKEDAEQRCKALFGVTDVRQLLREWS